MARITMLTRPTRLVPFLAAVVVALLIGGCASAPKRITEPAFWPPPPNYPRIQFLTGINSSADVEEQKPQLSIVTNLLGKEDTILPILKPYGIAERNGVLYVCDAAAARVVVIDIPRKKFSYLRGNTGLGKLKKPINITIDNQGVIYVADTGRLEVVAYTPEGDFLKTFGRDLGIKPVAVAVHGESLFVIDITKNEIAVLDRTSGERTGSFGKSDNIAESLSLPTNLTIDTKGIIHVTNAGSGKIMSYDRDGHFLGTFGSMGDIPGLFARPRGIAVDKGGLIYVIDAGFQNASIFNNSGRLLMTFGGIDSPRGGMNLPAGIAISSANLEYYQSLAEPSFKLDQVLFITSQYSANSSKISVYGLGRQVGVDYDKEYERLRMDRDKKAKEFREQKEKEEADKKQKEDATRDKAPAKTP